jgi:hypothetical protein
MFYLLTRGYNGFNLSANNYLVATVLFGRNKPEDGNRTCPENVMC